MSKYAFYPGCTLHSTGVEFGQSTELVCQVLGLEMVEIPDWNCCGASSAHSMDHTLFLALPARNLAQAQALDSASNGPLDLAIPCAACFSRLAAADLALRNDPAFRANVIYEGQYLLGTSFARPVTAKALVEDILSQPYEREWASRFADNKPSWARVLERSE